MNNPLHIIWGHLLNLVVALRAARFGGISCRPIASIFVTVFDFGLFHEQFLILHFDYGHYNPVDSKKTLGSVGTDSRHLAVLHDRWRLV